MHKTLLPASHKFVTPKRDSSPGMLQGARQGIKQVPPARRLPRCVCRYIRLHTTASEHCLGHPTPLRKGPGAQGRCRDRDCMHRQVPESQDDSFSYRLAWLHQPLLIFPISITQDPHMCSTGSLNSLWEHSLRAGLPLRYPASNKL